MATHQGEALKQLIKRTSFTVVDLCEVMGINRRTPYLWFAKRELPKDLVDRVGNVIGIDPYKSMPGVFTGVQSKITPVKAKAEKNAPDEELWKDKYIKAMNRIDTLQDALNQAQQKIIELQSKGKK